ncbi:Rrf2 family transcriptional regulator, partial [PVC group bacterium]|nr:Rrf2 family transcriptional regulator [PVC group bacterium]
MLFYSKPSQYALRAVSYIVRNKKKGACQAESIAKKENIPKPFLSKILKRLVEH